MIINISKEAGTKTKQLVISESALFEVYYQGRARLLNRLLNKFLRGHRRLTGKYMSASEYRRRAKRVNAWMAYKLKIRPLDLIKERIVGS